MTDGAAVDRLEIDVVAADGYLDVGVHCAGVDDPRAAVRAMRPQLRGPS